MDFIPNDWIYSLQWPIPRKIKKCGPSVWKNECFVNKRASHDGIHQSNDGEAQGAKPCTRLDGGGSNGEPSETPCAKQKIHAGFMQFELPVDWNSHLLLESLGMNCFFEGISPRLDGRDWVHGHLGHQSTTRLKIVLQVRLTQTHPWTNGSFLSHFSFNDSFKSGELIAFMVMMDGPVLEDIPIFKSCPTLDIKGYENICHCVRSRGFNPECETTQILHIKY